MLVSFRAAAAGLVAMLSLAFMAQAALAQQRSYQRDDLADAAIRLEADIKQEAGVVTRPLAVLRREADELLERREFRFALQLLAQIITVEPNAGANWLRLSRTILELAPVNNRERATLLQRAGTAAYIAYQRAADTQEEADSLVVLSRTFADRRVYRPALDTLRIALDLREEPEARARYEQMRADHGFRLLDYSVDSDAASPRACFQFSEVLAGARTDFSPFVSVAGMDRPALTADDKQLCVEGLKHGERYAVSLRAGLPSAVREALIRSAEFNIYVRDRKPSVRFTTRAYVLPKTGQRGIPVVSVNTDRLKVRILRIGDRNLLGTVMGYSFQRSLDRYDLDRIVRERGQEVWTGELSVEPQLNADVVTAFPVGEVLKDLDAGIYIMSAEPAVAATDSESYEALATQWFIVSDLGLATYSGADGVHVFAQSLATTAPRAGVEIQLLARNNEVLATRKTDDAGIARFEAGLARGEGGMAPALVLASDADGDHAFLSLRGSAFDLSDRGVAGRPAATGLEAFVYPERGVYRTGETVHLTAILRDARADAAAGTPLTLVIERPDGVEHRRAVTQDEGLGGHSLSMPIVGSAPTGTWRVNAFVDPKGSAVGSATFMVEDYVPDRLEFDLASPAGRIARDAPAEITLSGRYLYGAPGSGLTLEGEMLVRPASELPGMAGYRFGLADEDEASEQQTLEELPDTDAAGNAAFTVNLDKVPDSTKPLEARLTVRMAEPGGRAVERSLSLPVTPAAPMIGVKPLFAGSSLGDGDQATFDVAMVATDGRMIERKGLRYELLRVETRYQWYRQYGQWEYEPIRTTRRVADGIVDTSADKPGRIALPVTWGRYRLEVSTDDPSGPVTSVAFDAGFYAEAGSETPDVLEIALDKAEYRPGETIDVAVTARTAGKVTLAVLGDRLITTTVTDVEAGTAHLPLTVGEDWGAGAYVVATLRRPLDTEAQRMPGRAIGVQWFAVDRKARTLALDMTTPELVRPNTTMRVPLRVGGLAAGEEARVVVAAVDVGILNLTNYKPPEPEEFFLGQRQLSAEIRDLYGQLIDGMQGVRGAVRTGGDAGGELMGSPPTQPPLALYSGIVTVGADGTAEVTFDLPAFAGTVRVMATAWSKSRVGQANADVTVRDPVVLTATLPRFLLTGDESSLRLDLDNVAGEPGDYRLDVGTEGPLAVRDAGAQTLTLAAGERRGLALPLTATGVGVGAVSVRITGPGGFEASRDYTLAAKPATQVLTRRTVNPLAQGESITLSRDVFADMVGGTGGLAVSVGPSSALDVAALLKSLDRYPFGCSEQIASRAMPLLYVNDLASEAQLALDVAVDQRIREAIDRLMARQDGSGSFAMWSAGGGEPWLDAYVTDFLTRARERNFAVPDTGFRVALDRLRNFVANAPEPEKDGGRELAYALYVLARNGAAPVGDLRYLADTKLDALATPIAKAQIAAALAMLGDRLRAERVYAAALASLPAERRQEGRTDFGSVLRDASALVTLAAEGDGPRGVITAAVARIEAVRGQSTYLSTQEQAWMVLAARALGRQGGVALDIAGEKRDGAYYRQYRAEELGSSVRITNTGDVPVQAVVSVTGSPVTPEPATERGFRIERLYYTLDGEPADPTTARQNQRFVAVLRMTEPKPEYGRIVVADYLPAGFEIDNPRLVSSGDTGTLDWIEDVAEPVHSEFRDDRFAAAFDRKVGDKPVFAVAYVVRAVSPGRYVLPQAFVEDMYRPERFGRTGTGAITVEAAR